MSGNRRARCPFCDELTFRCSDGEAVHVGTGVVHCDEERLAYLDSAAIRKALGGGPS